MKEFYFGDGFLWNFPEMKELDLWWIDYTKLSPTEITIENIKATVFDWLEKYHPRVDGSNLKVDNPEDKEQLNRWRDWAIWRIKQQLLWAWFWNLSDLELSRIIAISLHEYFSEDPWYIPYLLDILPSTR